jgi:outer membrane protein assembly factor BamD
MLNIRLSVLALTLFGFAVTLLSGCSSTPTDPTAAWTPEKIYREARDEVSAGAWDRAAMLFEKLEGRAAGTPLAQQAQIEKAYAQYRATEKVQAIATLDRFLKLHRSRRWPPKPFPTYRVQFPHCSKLLLNLMSP